MGSLTLEQAKTVLSAAEEKAQELGVPMNIAIVDAGNNLTAFVRQEARGSARVIVFSGGIPLTHQDEILGAIGVSGGEVDQDHAVAQAGVAALGATA
jgi:uncharacterized protein GlcG (DUF336 family)